MFWENLAQANQRLAGCVVNYAGHPVRFPSAIDSRTLAVTKVVDSSSLLVSLDSEDFNNFRDVPRLGFMNLPGSLVLLRRMPVRNQVHGLSRSNTEILEYHKTRGFIRSEYNFDRLLANYGKYFDAMATGNYPDLSEAYEYSNRNQPLAITSKYAICCQDDGLKRLYRMSRPIGVVTDRNTIHLTSLTKFWQEDLQETLGNPTVFVES